MKCFYGCETIQAAETFIGFSGAPMLAHLFNGSQSALKSASNPWQQSLRRKHLDDFTLQAMHGHFQL